MRSDPDRVQIGDLAATPMRSRGTRPDGRRYWRIRRLGSSRETVATGWWTRDEAERAVEAARRVAPSIRSPRGVVLTVGDLLVRWVEVQEQRVTTGEIAQGTLEAYRTTARHWSSSLADVALERLTRPLVEDTLRSWRAAGVSARTTRLAHRVLVMILRWGHARGWGPSLDLARMSAAEVDPDERVNCDRTPPRSEVERVLAQLAPRWRPVVELLALTGARIGEVVALTVQSWDRERGELVLWGRDHRRARRGKVRPRRFPVTGRLAELLGELAADREDGPLVEGLPLRPPLTTLLEVACRRAGVERFTPHGVRRMVAMELLDVTDPRTVAELTGHGVKILLQDYVRPSQERLRDVVTRAHGGRPELRVIGRREPT